MDRKAIQLIFMYMAGLLLIAVSGVLDMPRASAGNSLFATVAAAEDLSQGTLQDETKPVPLNASFLTPPFLTAGKLCSLSVLDAAGNPLSHAGVYVDDELYSTKSGSTVLFRVPEQDSFEVSLLGAEKRKVARRKFKRVDDYYSEDERGAETASAILSLPLGRNASGPELLYTPSVLSPGQTFVLVGRNFSENLAENYVDIDGLNAPVLAASANCLVALAPTRLSIGPLREISVLAKDLMSNSVEVDVATPFFNYTKANGEEGQASKGKIGMNGSNMPCLIKVHNLDPDNTSLWSPKQEPLGKNNILLSPGGSQNYFDIDLRLLSNSIEPKIDLSLEQELSTQDQLRIPAPLLLAYSRADIIRLERRKTAAEYKLGELRKAQETKQESSDPEGKISSELKSLSLRVARLKRMLAARRAVYQSLGATDAQFRQALDDASNGAMLGINLSVQPIQIISDGGVGSVAVQLLSQTQPARTALRKARAHRLLEPVIRLLPPMDEAELAIFHSRQAEAAAKELDENKSLPAAETDPNTGLRPSLPEPEPAVSAGSRAPVVPADAPKPVLKQEMSKFDNEQAKKAAGAKVDLKKSSNKAASAAKPKASGAGSRSSRQNAKAVFSQSKSTRATGKKRRRRS